MNYYRRENGIIVGGPYNCDQEFQVEKLSDDNAEVLAFINRKVDAAPQISDGKLAALLVKQGVIPQSVVDAAIAAAVPIGPGQQDAAA